MTLAAKSLTVGYKGRPVLSSVDFSLEAGTMAVLIGANGSGKSTLLRTLAGLQAPLAGTVEIDGISLHSLGRREMARRMAVVLTGRHGGGALTVRECAAMGRTSYTGLFGHLSAADKEAVDRALADTGMLDKADRLLGSLSDGERQKAMIATALAQDAGIILLDEPTAFLDVAARLEILRLLRRLSDIGHVSVLSTHDVGAAIAQADCLMVADKSHNTLTVGPKADIIAAGTLDRAFADAGVHFDPTRGDFIS